MVWSNYYLKSLRVAHELLNSRVLHLLQHLRHHGRHLLLQSRVTSEQRIVGQHGGGLLGVVSQGGEHGLHVGGGHHLGHQGGVVPHLAHQRLHPWRGEQS